MALGDRLLIPAIYTNDPIEWQARLDRMLRHSIATAQLVNGEITPEDYEDSIADIGYDPRALCDLWLAGESLL